MGLYGLLRPGDRVVTTSVEHNSVMRPLRHLETRGVEVTVIACAPDGALPLDEVRRALRPRTRLLVTTHASNVLGTVMPIGELAAAAHAAGAIYLVDASQTAGALPIDVAHTGVDLLAFTGHKALLGPTGTGGLVIRAGLEVPPLMQWSKLSEVWKKVLTSMQEEEVPSEHWKEKWNLMLELWMEKLTTMVRSLEQPMLIR